MFCFLGHKYVWAASSTTTTLIAEHFTTLFSTYVLLAARHMSEFSLHAFKRCSRRLRVVGFQWETPAIRALLYATRAGYSTNTWLVWCIRIWRYDKTAGVLSRGVYSLVQFGVDLCLYVNETLTFNVYWQYKIYSSLPSQRLQQKLSINHLEQCAESENVASKIESPWEKQQGF